MTWWRWSAGFSLNELVSLRRWYVFWNSIKMWSGCTSLLLITPCLGWTDGASNGARLNFIICNKTLLAGPFSCPTDSLWLYGFPKTWTFNIYWVIDPEHIRTTLLHIFRSFGLISLLCANGFIHCNQSFFIFFCRSMLSYRPCLYSFIIMSVQGHTINNYLLQWNSSRNEFTVIHSCPLYMVIDLFLL